MDELAGTAPHDGAGAAVWTCPHCDGRFLHTQRQRCPTVAAGQAAAVAPPGEPASGSIAIPVPAAEASPAAPPAPSISVCPYCDGRYLHGRHERCPLDRSARVALPATRASRWTGVRSAARWTLAIAATVALIGAVFAAAYFVTDNLTSATADPQTALGGALISIAIGVAAMLVLFVTQRRFAKAVFAVLAITLVSGGVLMMSFAPAVRQMNVRHLAEYRAFNALLGFGALATAAGVILGVQCVRWAMRPHARAMLRRWWSILGAIWGVLIGLQGVTVIILLLALINGEAYIDETSGDVVSVVEQAISITVIGLWAAVPGLIFTYHLISERMGEASGEFRPPPVPLLVAAYAAVVALGGWNMLRDSPIAASMPVLHALAAALPGIALVAVAARGSWWRGHPTRLLTMRQVTVAVAFSMAVAASIAVYAESIGGLAAMVLIVAASGLPADAANVGDIFGFIEDADFYLSENEQFVANLVVAAVLAPVFEEIAKALGARALMDRFTTRSQAFVLGAAAGAGFGFLEALLYGLGVIGEDLGDWWVIMLVRGGSTSGHVLWTGIAAIGWWHIMRGERHRLARALFAAAIAGHAAWNTFAVILDSRIFWIETLSDRTIEYIAYAGVGIEAAFILAAIPYIAARLRRAEAATSRGLGELSPWLG